MPSRVELDRGASSALNPNFRKEHDVQNSFGLALRKARRDAKENLLRLAESATVSVAYVSQVERGEKNPPSESIIRLWLKILNCESRINEFLHLARTSVKTVQVSTKGKCATATNVLTALARSYEKNELSEEDWLEVDKILNRKKGDST